MSRIIPNSIRIGLCVCIYLHIALESAKACPICIGLPARTSADWVLEADDVVLVREDPDRRFHYRLHEVLKGDSNAEDYSLFVDSATRRRLNSDVGNHVVLVRVENGTWRSLGVFDEDYQIVLRRILIYEEEWKSNGGEDQRYRFFLSLLDHENRLIFELAYLELSRAPYDVIRKMATIVDFERLRPILERREFTNWRPLAILLLAQSDRVQDHEYIHRALWAAQRFNLTTNLAALAAAEVEVRGDSALDDIDKFYIQDSTRTKEEIRQILIALAVLGEASDEAMQTRIVSSLGHALENHPTFAGEIARSLNNWHRDELKSQLCHIMSDANLDLSDDDRKSILRYLD